MLAPIPSVMLKDKAILHVPVSMDEYQKPVCQDFEINHVHIQNSNQIKQTSQNEQVVLRAILFVDGRKSTPHYDYMSLMAAAEAVGTPMTATVIEASGNRAEYTVDYVDAVPDVPANRTHHIEIGLT
ncbi:MAG: hypothetical protein IIZ78_11520 [Clostridiales bacterium]|nr:hypothetical protein [Clostridiales bacterium]